MDSLARSLSDSNASFGFDVQFGTHNRSVDIHIVLMIFLYLSVTRPFAFVINTEVGCSLCRASGMPKPPAIWSPLKMLQVVSQCTQTPKVSYAATILSVGLRRDE